jgi:multidrug transporter EmrE-like cation transporter
MPSVFLFLTFSILATAGAQIMLKKGVLAMGQPVFSVSGIFNLFLQVFHNMYLLLGLVFFGLSFFSWLFVLSKLQLNIAYPIITGINFLLVTLGSWLLFKESISFLQIFGMGFIILGAFLILKP